MTTFCRLIAKAPFAREVVTIIGSISGVNPTAIEMANRAACIQLPLVKPLTKNTTGTIISIKRIRTHDTELTPFSKELLGGFVFSFFATSPIIVSFPTTTTIAFALPLITVLPAKTRLGVSVNRHLFGDASPFFSTGSLSPVRADWLTNRSFAASIRISAGIISPADSQTISPTTTSSRGISFLIPSL